MGELSELEIMEFQECGLTGTIPRTLGKLTKLHEMYINDNKLTGTLPKELGQLKAARVMWLQNNNLEGMIPTEPVQLLSSLEDLNVGGNKFSPEELPSPLAKKTLENS